MAKRKTFSINGRELTLISNTSKGLETVQGICRGFDNGMVVMQEDDCLLFRHYPVGSRPGYCIALPGRVQVTKPSRPAVPSQAEVKAMRRVEGGPAEDLWDFDVWPPKAETIGYSELDRIPTPDLDSPRRHIDDAPLNPDPYAEYVFGTDDIDDILRSFKMKEVS